MLIAALDPMRSTSITEMRIGRIGEPLDRRLHDARHRIDQSSGSTDVPNGLEVCNGFRLRVIAVAYDGFDETVLTALEGQEPFTAIQTASPLPGAAGTRGAVNQLPRNPVWEVCTPGSVGTGGG